MHKLLTITILAFLFTGISAQDSLAFQNLKKFVVNIQAFNYLYPQEKVYLHFDNTGYYLDETIWFKAYCVTASQHLPDTMSRVLYVELLNPLGKVLDTKKLKIVNGQCHGDFFLNPFNYDYLAGFYEIRAYTKWMLNFGEETIFSRVFPVFNAPQEEGDYSSADMKNTYKAEGIFPDTYRKNPSKSKKLNVSFYPEGGNLVKDIPSNVAFKATDEKGKGIEITGKVVNSKGRTIADFSSIHHGMGSFVYTPDGTNKVIVYYDGHEHRVNLPKHIDTGYVLSVDNRNRNALQLKIQKSKELAPDSLGVSVLCRGDVLYFTTIETAEDTVSLAIPQRIFRAGVNQITLFDRKGEIVAERMIFSQIPDKEKITLTAKTNKTSYRSRERINIDMKANAPIEFSLAVRDAAHLPPVADYDNLFTNFLLSSELKGFIENPGSYFSSKDTTCIRKLDLLMMVQGWRRYKWQQMSGVERTQLTYDVEKRLKIKGHVVGKAQEVSIWLGKDDMFMEGTFPVNEKGEFAAYMDDFTGVWDLSLRVDDLKDANKNIRLDRWFSPPPRSYYYPELQLDHTNYITDSLSNQMKLDKNPTESYTKINRTSTQDTIPDLYELTKVEVTEKKGKELIYNVERDYERNIDTGKDVSRYIVFDYLVGKNNGFIYISNDIYVPIDNSYYSSAGGFWKFGIYNAIIKNDTNHSLLSTGGRIHNYQHSIAREISEVQQIVVYIWKQRRIQSDLRNVWNASDFNEITVPILIVPYVSNYAKKRKEVRYTYLDGFSKVNDFYQNTPQRENYVPDVSEHTRTLYWNPNVKTDKDGKVKISFYNNNFCERIDISAEGITNNGIPFTNK